MKSILIVNGPNLNLTGKREPGLYGNETLESINAALKKKAEEQNINVSFFQSNCEGEIIDKIHTMTEDYDGGIINAGAYSHYSYAIRDAVSAVKKPFIEVHMSNIYAREEFRRHSVISAVCAGVVAGFGKDSYLLALYAIKDLI